MCKKNHEKLVYLRILLYFCSRFRYKYGIIMSEILDNIEMANMYRRWAYMAVAILASALLFLHPVFDFNEDKGIIYVRSFSMDQKTFYVTQTDLKTGVPEITETMSVSWLYYCNKVMLWGCIICFFCFFSNPLRVYITYIVAVISGSYYIIMVYYAMQISELHFATLYPNYMCILPAVVCAMMVLTGQNVIRDGVYRADKSMESYDVH